MSVNTEHGSSQKRQKSRAENSYPRKRALQACKTCRIRRTKCDNGRPTCSACQNLGAECVYQEKDNSTLDFGTLTILERLDSLEALLLSPTRNSTDTSPSNISQSQVEKPAIFSPANLSSPVLPDEYDSFSHSITVEGVLSWPLWNGQFDRHPKLKELLQGRRSDTSSKKTRPTSEAEILGEDHLIQNYFQTFHIFNPVLDERLINEYRRDTELNGYQYDTKSCLLLLVFALGNIAEAETYWAGTVSSLEWKQSPSFQNAESCFVSAQKRFGLILAESGVLEAQCLFLAGVYLMSTLRPLDAWRMFVQAVAICQSFHPFQEQSISAPDGDKPESSAQDSIYWTCFKSELELRLELQLSEMALRDYKYPAFFPSPPRDLQPEREAMWYFYLGEIALQRLRGRILYNSYKYQITGSTVYDMVDMVLNFELQARDWMSSLPPALALDREASMEKSGTLSEHQSLRLILHSHLLDCYEVLYWPFLKEVLNMDLAKFVQDKQPSSTVLSFAQKGLDICIDRIEQTESGFRSRHHGSWLTLRSCTRSALVLMATRHRAVQSPELTQHLQLPASLISAVEKVMNLLRFWQLESDDTRDRLQLLENLMGSTETPP